MSQLVSWVWNYLLIGNEVFPLLQFLLHRCVILCENRFCTMYLKSVFLSRGGYWWLELLFRTISVNFGPYCISACLQCLEHWISLFLRSRKLEILLLVIHFPSIITFFCKSSGITHVSVKNECIYYIKSFWVTNYIKHDKSEKKKEFCFKLYFKTFSGIWPLFWDMKNGYNIRMT